MRVRRRRTLPTLWEVLLLTAGAGLGFATLIRHDPMYLLPQHWARITTWDVALTADLSGVTVSVMLLLIWHRSARHRAWNDGAVMFLALGLTVIALAGLAMATRFFSGDWDARPGGTDLLWWVTRGLRVVRFGGLSLTIAALMSGRYRWWTFRSHWVDSVGMWLLGAWALLAVFDLHQVVRA